MRKIGDNREGDERVKNTSVFLTLLMITTVFASPFMVASTQNVVYLDHGYSNAMFCNTTEVEIWINAENFQSGQINLTYDTNCADVTNWIRNTTNFPMGGWDSSTDGKEWITFLALSPLTGEYHVGTLTLHGVCEEACSTPLEFTSPSALFDPYGTEITTNWLDGEFACSETPTSTPTPISTPSTGGGSGREVEGGSSTPTSTVTSMVIATPVPSLSPTSAPISFPTPALSSYPTLSPTPTSMSFPKQKPEEVPGFEAFFVILGILLATFLPKP
jgi:hypothetical protein